MELDKEKFNNLFNYGTTAEMNEEEFQLEMESFREWLISLDPNESVGTQKLCPINFMLNDITKDDQWAVDYNWTSINTVDDEGLVTNSYARVNPTWMKRFTNRIDNFVETKKALSERPGYGWGWNDLTPKDCLEVLDALELEDDGE